MNNALIIQQCLSAGGYTGNWAGIFYDQLRLTQQRHASYARAHLFDYWLVFGDVHPEHQGGAWDKIVLILDALKRGYPYIVWMDTDAAIMDMSCDLRQALPAGTLIGAVEHDPEKSAYLRQCQVPKHHNVGVLYVRNDPRTVQFFADWLAAWPGDQRWAEQGVFQQMIAGKPWAVTVEDKWNATVNVNMVDKPAVMGWHGIMPPEARLQMMRMALKDDYLKFRV